MRHEEASSVSLGEAAKMVARGQTTVRDWVKNGQVQAKRNSLGHWLIERDSLLSFASTEGEKEGPRRITGAITREHPPTATTFRRDSEALIETLRSEVQHLKELLREERQRCRQLESERTQHLAEMRTLLSKDTKATDGLISRWLRR